MARFAAAHGSLRPYCLEQVTHRRKEGPRRLASRVVQRAYYWRRTMRDLWQTQGRQGARIIFIFLIVEDVSNYGIFRNGSID